MSKQGWAVVAACAFALLIPSMSVFAASSPGYNWNGFYVGLNLGGASSFDVKTTESGSAGGLFPVGTSYNSAGHSWKYDTGASFMGGAAVGYNFQVASTVFGLEGEFGYLSLRGSKSDPLSPNLDT
ncbi:MAG TPA: hypothetical protein VE131_08925, partial [Terriglobales bacterium]|nr:hypothetical protein [Terriglobales bacterium]